jgi:hypothetical protein
MSRVLLRKLRELGPEFVNLGFPDPRRWESLVQNIAFNTAIKTEI